MSLEGEPVLLEREPGFEVSLRKEMDEAQVNIKIYKRILELAGIEKAE